MADLPCALVTGCSSGIGRATALALVQAGYPTWATARRLETLAELEAAGCRVLQLDVTDEASRVRAVKAVEAEHGAIGVLVNNAGYAQLGPVEEVPLDALYRQFDTNVFGLVRMCQLVLPAMRSRRSGTIVNIGSVAGLITPLASSAYSMTKYALEALSDALRLELRGFGIRVVLVEPGDVRTEFTATSMATVSRGERPGPYETLIRGVTAIAQQADRPGERGVSEPEDVARVVVKAVSARRPKTRYKIGTYARVAPWIRRVVPDRLWDSMMLRGIPFPSED
jgi:NAD(P)-dependent dehydrogenase (short-subunit alcohol dehydrogenase family)